MTLEISIGVSNIFALPFAITYEGAEYDGGASRLHFNVGPFSITLAWSPA